MFINNKLQNIYSVNYKKYIGNPNVIHLFGNIYNKCNFKYVLIGEKVYTD